MKLKHILLLLPLIFLGSKIENETLKDFYSNPGMKKEEAFKIIYSLNDLVKGINYELDSVKKPGKISSPDYWQNPEETYSLKSGDCEDKAIFLNDTLKKLGLETKLVFGAFSKSSEKGHLWQEFFVEGKCFIIESSVNIGIYDKKKALEDGEYINKKNFSFFRRAKEYALRNNKKLPIKH